MAYSMTPPLLCVVQYPPVPVLYLSLDEGHDDSVYEKLLLLVFNCVRFVDAGHPTVTATLLRRSSYIESGHSTFLS